MLNILKKIGIFTLVIGLLSSFIAISPVRAQDGTLIQATLEQLASKAAARPQTAIDGSKGIAGGITIDKSLFERKLGKTTSRNVGQDQQVNYYRPNPRLGTSDALPIGPSNGQPDNAPQTLPNIYTSGTLQSNQALGYSFIPPGTMGAAGPAQFVTTLNGQINFRNRLTGAFDPAIANNPIDEFTFFGPAHRLTDNGNGIVRVRFDRFSGRWIFTEMGQFATPSRANFIYMAMSDGPVITPTTVFTYFYFQTGLVPPIVVGEAALYLEQASLGVDQYGIYIGGNLIDQNAAYRGSTAFYIRKSAMTNSDLIVANAVTAFRGLVNTTTFAGAYAPQGVDNFDANPTVGYFIGIDLSDPRPVNQPTTSNLAIYRVTNLAAGTPTISGPFFVPIPTVDLPYLIGAPQGQGPNLDPVDGRLIAAHIRYGQLWTSHAVGLNAAGTSAYATGGTPDRIGAVWYTLGNLTGAPNIAQRGVQYDNGAAATARSYLVPSIMSSGQNHAAIGFTLTASNLSPSAATMGRLSSDAAGTLQGAPVVYQAGAAAQYNLRFGGGVVRWGDYSYTSLDPCDDMSMYTIQEFVTAPAIAYPFGGGENGNWGVAVARLLAPPPIITSVSPNPVSTGQGAITLTLTGTGFYNPGPEVPVFAACPNNSRFRLNAGGVTGLTVTTYQYISPTQATLTISTVGVQSGGTATITLTNPDDQTAVITFTVGAQSSQPPAINPTPGKLPATGYPPIEGAQNADRWVYVGVLLIGVGMVAAAIFGRRKPSVKE